MAHVQITLLEGPHGMVLKSGRLVKAERIPTDQCP